RVFLNRRRLEEARQLLQTSRVPLAEIARQTGFSDLPHFNRAFKAEFQTPPETYRRNLRQEISVI
ncbi:MAG: helix-turn-helix domain-containing protein, partial [Cytophagales bacterium]|nr:helix-turn-helix domain-containing protein [Armatimonadota bacterium]